MVAKTGRRGSGGDSRSGSTEARPLFVGDWPDPTILKDGADYYMTHTSGLYRPALLVWHSTDLRRWTPLGHAVQRQAGSIWAPELVKHNGRYFLYYPAAGNNWVVTADSPGGPWSEPRALGVGHIDPGHVADDEGRRYVHLSAGHVVDISEDGLKATTPPRKVYEGWPIPVDWAIECFCLESPKLTRKDGWYYLTSAQGGTFGPSTSHMVISARSQSPLGPWENSPHNPIIRTWRRDEAWWSKGHGTLVEGPDGRWWCVLHAIMNGHRALGRCTTAEPIEWTDDGWFHVAPHWPDGWDEPARLEMPLSDEFESGRLGIQWQFHGEFDPGRFNMRDGALTLEGCGEDPGRCGPLCVMPPHRAYEVETDVEVHGDCLAGLMLFNGPDTYIGSALAPDGVVRRVQEGCRRYGWHKASRVRGSRIQLRIVNNRQDVRFYVKEEGRLWQIIQPSMELSSWGGVRPALFACGSGHARFHGFRYKALESSTEMARWLHCMRPA